MKRDKRCVKCGCTGPTREQRRAPFEKTRRECIALTLEVNHIVPRVGRALHKHDCGNHLDNLEVLCHRDHLIVTAEQKAMRGRAEYERQQAVFAANPHPQMTLDDIHALVEREAGRLSQGNA